MKWSHDYKRDVLHPNKTDLQDITEILLKVALNTINQIILHREYQTTDGTHLMPVIWGMELA
jgi:hypothetical protein